VNEILFEITLPGQDIGQVMFIFSHQCKATSVIIKVSFTFIVTQMNVCCPIYKIYKGNVIAMDIVLTRLNFSLDFTSFYSMYEIEESLYRLEYKSNPFPVDY